jgi:homoserine kinase type II
MTLDEARALGALYGLEVNGLKPVPAGSVNSNFILELSDAKRVFARVCEESAREQVVVQNRLLGDLIAGGVSTPSPLVRGDGTTVAEHAGKPVVLFGFSAGESLCQQRVRPVHTAALGGELARIHRVGRGYQGAPVNRFGIAQLGQRLAGIDRAGLSDELGADLSLLAERLDELAERTTDHPADTVIHGDVFRDNVLWLEDGSLSAMLDFESASLGNVAFDLMVTMHAWCFGDDLEAALVRALVGGYQAERELAADELAMCFDQARLAAVRFAITRITDFELRPRGVVVYKDYRRFMGRLRAVEAVGRDAFPAWLTGA